MQGNAEKTTDRTDAIFRALASKPRREILKILAEGDEDERCCGTDEVCACVFAEKLGIGAPTVSHHMKALIDAGLVTSRKKGLWVYYRLRPEPLLAIADELRSVAAGCCEGGCR